MTEKNTVMVVDGGGRGSAVCDAYARSPLVGRVINVPGNALAGINTDKDVVNYPGLKTTSTAEILEIGKREKVDLVDVAQDNAVAVDLASELRLRGFLTVGPSKLSGRIEWDKAWERNFGDRHDIPQPFYRVCYAPHEGRNFIHSQADQPWFIKASGLAEGKGALPARNNDEAMEGISEISRFGDAGSVFLIEKWLRGDDGSPGEEFSTFVLSDGYNYRMIGNAQDHKRVNDDDKGPNTGGMGCSTPPKILSPEFMEMVEKQIIEKTLNGLRAEKRPYNGVLYLNGMAIKRDGVLVPYVIEFNARWGDPEAQVILPGITNDWFEVGMATALGNIANLKIESDGKSRVVVAGTSKGYPIDYSQVKGKEIFGLHEARKVDGVRLYGAGVTVLDGRHYASGGRLFYLVGEGNTVAEARERAYEAMSLVRIEGDNLHYRSDIGLKNTM